MKKIVLFCIFLVSLSLHSEDIASMRRCLLLPIADGLEGAIGSKVFEEVETYLRDGNWCYYKSNSGLISVLTKYRNNLKTHLDNPEVLRTLAEKTKTGSLIKIDILNEVKGVDLGIKIYFNF